MRLHNNSKTMVSKQKIPLPISKLEEILITTHKKEMISYVLGHPSSYEELFQLAVSDRQPYAWRAAWLLWSCLTPNAPIIHDHLKQILTCIRYKPFNQQRELIKIISMIELPQDAEGEVFDVCASLWQKIEAPPALRYNAMKLMTKIVKKYPDLYSELEEMTDGYHVDTLTKGASHSVKKMLKNFQKQ